MEAVVAWKKTQNHYNFNSLPKTAVLTAFAKKKSLFPNLKQKRLRGIKGDLFLESNRFVFCYGCSHGAAHIVGLCEELRALGVSQFIFIGFAGRLTSELQEGDLFYLDATFSGTGTSYYYDNNELVSPENKILYDQLNTNNRIPKTTGWSTDAPFRETNALKKYYVEKGAQVVEMESAAIYAFANFYGLQASCYVITSDILADEWVPPTNFSKLIQKEQSFIADIKNSLWNL